ncbi:MULTISPECIES: multidrug DMT transporter permease [Lysinibacillus]|uniref:multidrug DMT transporter permease n=1 Tax=Lysinibacillus TaxID=400634 RepID=UPI00214C98D0|nr:MULTISPECIES: multidrug DMT transporter permease [Lysinibacillus]UUV26222.1 multidrug DMT transporter permease [Lysinibacillus sp. FN11]UYB49094.1 multidrug DMT transporter permease [Lysinibacillus capsici]
MKTKWLLSSSAVLMGLFGLAGTFFPEEISKILGIDPSPIILILLQIIGGLYLGFAMLNWFTRSALIGGIYNKPVILGNLIYCIVVFFALFRQLAEKFHFIFAILTVVYLGFAVWFTLVLRSNPFDNQSKMSV